MKNKLFSLGLMLLAVSSSAMAVDGYKGVKFGSSFNELKAAKMCTWVKSKDDVKGLTSYFCDDFKFSGKQSQAAAFFKDGKFEIFAIGITENVENLIDGLEKKYGFPSSRPTAEENERFGSEGGIMSIKFDNDTVAVNASFDVSSRNGTVELVYCSKNSADVFNALRQKSLDDDI